MSQSDNRLHLRYGVSRNVRTKHRRGDQWSPATPIKPKSRRGGVSPPACRAKNPSKTIPQALPRQLPFTGGCLLVCANIAGNTLHIAGRAGSCCRNASPSEEVFRAGAGRLLVHTKLYPFLRKNQEVRKGKRKNSAAKCKNCVKSRARARVARVWLLLYWEIYDIILFKGRPA